MRRPLARLWIMAWAVKSLSPEIDPHPEERAQARVSKDGSALVLRDAGYARSSG
jgi:hypothetical protein